MIALAAAAADDEVAELALRLGELGPVVLLAAQHAGLPDGVAFVKADLTPAEEAEASWRADRDGHLAAGRRRRVPRPRRGLRRGRQLARTLASEVGEHGVTVNAVSVVPGRMADAAAAIRLLCSPDSGFLTSEALSPLGAPAP